MHVQSGKGFGRDPWLLSTAGLDEANKPKGGRALLRGLPGE